MYATICTRPNLAYAVSVMSHYIRNLGKDHWEALKWILCYVKGSLNKCLMFDKSKIATYNVAGLIDSDYGGDLDHRCSTSGSIFTLCWCCLLESISIANCSSILLEQNTLLHLRE